MSSEIADREFVEWLKEQIERALQDALSRLTNGSQEKEFYTPAEVAKTIGRAEYTVREWCRLGRIKASKRHCGRGNAREWMIAAAEVRRLQNEGLLPPRVA